MNGERAARTPSIHRSPGADDRQREKAGSARPTQQAEHQQPLLFSRPEASLYTSLSTLPQRAGVSTEMLPSLVAKEFADNALDAADAAGRPGEVEIGIDRDGNLTISDAGIGIAHATPEKLASIFCVARAMISSKLLRRPTRGCVGNGLRVCLGWLTATRGRLIVETGDIRVELVPDIDGQSRIGKIETIEAIAGLRLIAVVATSGSGRNISPGRWTRSNSRSGRVRQASSDVRHRTGWISTTSVSCCVRWSATSRCGNSSLNSMAAPAAKRRARSLPRSFAVLPPT
jgi:hypothetical protein